jgi:hypothetical protein
MGDGTRLQRPAWGVITAPAPGRRQTGFAGMVLTGSPRRDARLIVPAQASDAAPRKRPPNRANLCFYIGPELKLAQIQLCMGSGLAWPLAYTARVKRQRKYGNGTEQDLIAEPGNRAKLEEEGGRGSEPEPRVLAMRAACHVV